MRLFLLPLGLVAGLAACGTPQEQCIRGQTRDLRTLDRLITETESNLTRGYALEEVRLTRSRWVLCQPSHVPVAGQPQTAPQMCLDDVEYTELRPRAIDLADEKRKLTGMRVKRDSLARAAQPAIRACKAQYPE